MREDTHAVDVGVLNNPGDNLGVHLRQRLPFTLSATRVSWRYSGTHQAYGEHPCEGREDQLNIANDRRRLALRLVNAKIEICV
jgi:hypothetical protein